MIEDGRAAGGAALQGKPRPAASPSAAATPGRSSRTRTGKDFVDFDEDQTVQDLLNAVADGFDDPELAKRYTTTGMGPSQGRHSALNALRIVRRASPLGAEAVGRHHHPAPALPARELRAISPAAASSPPASRRCTTGTWRWVRG